jgi:anti-sigma B factor antagonist
VEVTETDFGAVVAIAGEVDLATAPRVSSALASTRDFKADRVIVDLSGVTFMDSTGLGVLLTFDRELRARGGRLTIACPDGPARLLFEVTGVEETLPLYWSRAAAVAAAISA